MSKSKLIILIFTALAVISWVVADLFLVRSEAPLSEETKAAVEPVSPDFNQTTLDLISKTIKSQSPPPIKIITPDGAGKTASASTKLN